MERNQLSRGYRGPQLLQLLDEIRILTAEAQSPIHLRRICQPIRINKVPVTSQDVILEKLVNLPVISCFERTQNPVVIHVRRDHFHIFPVILLGMRAPKANTRPFSDAARFHTHCAPPVPHMHAKEHSLRFSHFAYSLTCPSVLDIHRKSLLCKVFSLGEITPLLQSKRIHAQQSSVPWRGWRPRRQGSRYNRFHIFSVAACLTFECFQHTPKE